MKLLPLKKSENQNVERFERFEKGVFLKEDELKKVTGGGGEEDDDEDNQIIYPD